MRRFRLAALALAACAAVPAWGLDLAEAYQLALERDATIRQARALADAGRERLPQAQAQLLPSVTASSTRFRNQLHTTAPNFAGTPVTTFSRYQSENDTLTLRQPIYRKQLSAQYDQARAVVADANARLEAGEQDLVMRVTQAYFEALLAEEELTLVGVQKAAYAAQVDAARKSFAAGAGTRTDVDEAQSRFDLAVAQELEARQNVDFARRRLQVLIDQPVAQLAPVNVARLQLAPPQLASVDEWTAEAEATSPEIASARAQVEAARADVDRARAGHYPTLDAIAQLSRSTSENVLNPSNRYRQKQVGLQLSVPLYQGGLVNSQVREALANLERMENRLEEIRRDLGVRIHQEFRGVTEGVAKVRALEQAVRSAEQVVHSSRRSFEAGVRTRLDILNAEQQAGQARRDLAQARFMYLMARVRLKALAGALRAENIDEINAWLQH